MLVIGSCVVIVDNSVVARYSTHKVVGQVSCIGVSDGFFMLHVVGVIGHVVHN